MASGVAHPNSNALATYIRSAIAVPFDKHHANCGLFVADWIRLVRGIDPAEGIRGQYVEGAEFERLVARLAAGCGLQEIAPEEAQAGDVGLLKTKADPMLAICAGPRWAARRGRGLWSGRAKVLRAWRV